MRQDEVTQLIIFWRAYRDAHETELTLEQMMAIHDTIQALYAFRSTLTK